MPGLHRGCCRRPFGDAASSTTKAFLRGFLEMTAALDLAIDFPLAFTAFPLAFAALLGITSAISHISERLHHGVTHLQEDSVHQPAAAAAICFYVDASQHVTAASPALAPGRASPLPPREWPPFWRRSRGCCRRQCRWGRCLHRCRWGCWRCCRRCTLAA